MAFARRARGSFVICPQACLTLPCGGVALFVSAKHAADPFDSRLHLLVG